MSINTTVKGNIKSITTNSVSIPVEAAAVSLELASDLSTVALSTVKGVVPLTKQLGNICGMFITGMFNSDMDEEKARKVYEETTIRTVMTAIEAASLKAGQDLVSPWDESKESITTAEKQEVLDE